MDYPILIDTLSMELSVLFFKRLPVKISMSLKIVFFLANSADPDEMRSNAALHLVLHCLLKYLFTCIQNGKG